MSLLVDKLTHFLSKMPGVGGRLARKLSLSLLEDDKIKLTSLIAILKELDEKIIKCSECQNFDSMNPCFICTSKSRDSNVIAIVENILDLWAIERSGVYNGHYYILGAKSQGSIRSAVDNFNLDKLRAKILKNNTKEIIIATNATISGQTTAFYISDYLSDLNLTISRLASGIPIGCEIDYVDSCTLSEALKLRKEFV